LIVGARCLIGRRAVVLKEETRKIKEMFHALIYPSNINTIYGDKKWNGAF
jgi:hypothetical protein